MSLRYVMVTCLFHGEGVRGREGCGIGRRRRGRGDGPNVSYSPAGSEEFDLFMALSGAIGVTRRQK